MPYLIYLWELWETHYNYHGKKHLKQSSISELLFLVFKRAENEQELAFNFHNPSKQFPEACE